jgi:hypothetical protein
MEEISAHVGYFGDHIRNQLRFARRCARQPESVPSFTGIRETMEKDRRLSSRSAQPQVPARTRARTSALQDDRSAQQAPEQHAVGWQRSAGDRHMLFMDEAAGQG